MLISCLYLLWCLGIPLSGSPLPGLTTPDILLVVTCDYPLSIPVQTGNRVNE